MTASRSGLFSRLVRVVRTLVSVALALAGLGLFLAWMGGAFHDKVPPGVVPLERTPVGSRMVVAVERTIGPESVTAVGSVQPHRKTDVASRLMAAIRDLTPRPGDRVMAGDVLVTLDDRELVAQQREAAATLASAEADLATRKADYDRIKNLRDTGSVSPEEYNRIEGAYRVTEAQVRRAKETTNRIDVQLTYTKILATGDGVVADRFADPGDLATPGKTILTVYDPSDLELQANVPESLASSLRVGQSLAVRIDAIGLTVPAPVREIVPQAQQASRSVLVKFALPQSTSVVILPGMFGLAVIQVGLVERIWVPDSAVRRHGQLDLVDVVDADGYLTRRFVRVGKAVDGKAEILSGLSAGEKVALPAQ